MSGDSRENRIADELRSDDPQVRMRAILRFSREPYPHLSAAALSALVSCLGAARKAVARRAAEALTALAGSDRRVVPALREALRASDARGRFGAAYALGLVEGALELEALEALLEALGGGDGDVRWAAAELIVRLGRIYPEEVKRGLIALGATGNPVARKMALYCLRDLGFADREVRALASRSSRDADHHLRLAALSLLARLPGGGHESAEIAMRLLESDQSEGVRRAAASALGRLKYRSPQVIEALQGAASQRADGSLRKAAEQALTRLEHR